MFDGISPPLTTSLELLYEIVPELRNNDSLLTEISELMNNLKEKLVNS